MFRVYNGQVEVYEDVGRYIEVVCDNCHLHGLVPVGADMEAVSIHDAIICVRSWGRWMVYRDKIYCCDSCVQASLGDMRVLVEAIQDVRDDS